MRNTRTARRVRGETEVPSDEVVLPGLDAGLPEHLLSAQSDSDKGSEGGAETDHLDLLDSVDQGWLSQ